MKERCENENQPHFKHYGGRGIAVCAEWRSDFAAFRDWALAQGYGVDLDIDRIDNARGYEPANCRWVPRSVNCRNKRSNKIIEAFGESKCVADWAEDPRCVVSRDLLYNRLNRGTSPEVAIARPA